ncbi:alpha/beta hydrolase-fold protein [Brevibacillus formosus]|uniref:Alpha/beta hydrolase n=1 Tax=Brevibacillus formosus TaxID=54913 RepID=A0A837KPY0_9BACL|nr:alpha/beta hydrolase-fold protein [Brevibacillus formosus]KLH99624.1 alpha/beta hydrolase [Brevibacillus formosus]MED1959828.1 alpha/beta hydrolase-fold protein [Brevibacillus formosus]PSJ95675.1 alpha/beta hydrolase [Brevibacillus formosus]GED56013.1 ferri-bacillibactin esterase BesA [Brevibacillus formosus]
MKMIEKNGYSPRNCVEWTLQSSQGRDYRIMIAIPEAKAPPEGYAVIYAVDGDAMFGTIAETVKLQTRKPKGFNPAIVVGIGYPSRLPFDMDRRCYDLTMPVDSASLPDRPNGEPWPEHGGVDLFLDFLEQQLMPAISSEWQVNPKKQAIFGHSLGGHFTLYTLFSRPKLFSHVVSGSPSVWWGNEEVLREQERFITQWKGDHELKLLVIVGGDELSFMVEGAQRVVERMEPLTTKGVQVSFIKFEDEGHVSVLPSAINRLVRFVLTD